LGFGSLRTQAKACGYRWSGRNLAKSGIIHKEQEWNYDTSHGFAHKDIINPAGSKEKILLGEVSYDELLTEADKDINENWEEYKKKYVRRMKDG